MRIAIATEGSQVSEHFGRCENFTMVDIENSEVKSKTLINTVGNQHGKLPEFLKKQQVMVVISGGMGAGARENLISNNIDIITGASGDIDTVILEYLNQTLKSNHTGCSGDSHEHDSNDVGCSCGHH